VMFYTRFASAPRKLAIYLTATIAIGLWAWLNLMSSDLFIDKLNSVGLTALGSMLQWWPFNMFGIETNELNIFVAVVFASSPGVFRIVRGLVLDVKTRDYIAAAQTR
ncbi:MAG: hypothetical protein KDJ51_14040, partial [Nitratireductor sp.]|nr:hypothetical protein [Nitratireductor sp.]